MTYKDKRKAISLQSFEYSLTSWLEGGPSRTRGPKVGGYLIMLDKN